MQIIQNIREKGAAIVIIIIALSLIGFILMDANLGSNRSASSSPTIGKVNGESIESAEYADKVRQIEEQYGGRANGAQIYQIRQSAWDQIVAEKVLQAEFDKLGYIFTPKELSATMFSDDAPYTLKQAFSDKATGKYDISKAQQWWATAKKSKGEQRQAVEQQIVEPIRLQSLYSRYSGMIAAAGYYPTWLKEKETAESKTFANISFVNVPYSVIPDSTVKVSDQDLLDYVGKHKAMYKQDEGRYISYVTFSTNPTGADTAKVLESVSALKQQFAADTNAQAFVSRNMSAKEFDSAYVPKSKLTSTVKDTLATLAINTVYGPYLDGNDFTIAKMLGSKQVPDSIKARHILISTNPQSENPMDDSTAKKLADSLLAAINAGGDFAALALKYSADGSKEKGGDLGTFTYGQMVPEFNNFVATKPIGSKGVVQTQFGYHVIEVLGQSNFQPAYKIAYMSKEIIPSDETVNAAGAKATKLSGDVKNQKALDEYLAKNNLQNQKVDYPTLVKENDYQLGALQDARQLIKWAFEAEEGDISEPFNIGDQFVVATVTKVQPKGLPDAKTARPLVEYTVRNLKKAEQIKAKLNGKTGTLESAAAVYSLQPGIAGADSSLTFSSQIINGVGQEPKVIGASFNKAYLSKVSEPIAGTSGVYLIKVNSTGTKPADSAEQSAKQSSDRTKALSQQINGGWFEALKNLADIKDDRSKIN